MMVCLGIVYFFCIVSLWVMPEQKAYVVLLLGLIAVHTHCMAPDLFTQVMLLCGDLPGVLCMA
jgi:hypothetical protein